ncbi:uncharacterized protein A4U43_C09F6390 [Asparagus officinalis]|uniref:DNA polymerase alpha subunit B n=1 Tax=Asparagus officinalis TaxID=4686 RepID=A0A5P1E5Y6_ASPOF|nr:DNA polymerase alpha subunit B [Asparagus officinalis]ONK57978.1 uncharacterized protein A4U43_C09F6390 [Asparagus officinalis]
MDAEIKAEFERNGFLFQEEEEQILQKCLSMCINYSLSPSDLVSNWEIYYLNRQLSGLVLESSHMDGLLLYIQNDMKEKLIKEEPHLHIYSSNDVDMLLNDEHDSNKEDNFESPSCLHERPFSETSNGSSTPTTNEKPSSSKNSKIINDRITPFGQRINKFVSQFTFNTQNQVTQSRSQELENEDDDVIRRVQPGERCSLHIHSSQPEPGCRFMFDRVEDRFNYLENRIKRHALAYAASGLHGEVTDATLASQNSMFAVGMVCSDGEGCLNGKSILLQGSVEHSGGQRVRLDLEKLDQFSLFPGQVIGIEGHNPSGHCLIASKVIDLMPYSDVTSLPPAKRQAIDHQPNSEPSMLRMLSMVIAAGPFTTIDNLLFEPLTELLAYARRRQPQLLILMGPFVDSEHPEIKKGTVDRTFDEIFHVEIIRRLQDYTEFMGSSARVILMPSTRDANHDFVFPQPAFDIHLPEGMKNQIAFLTNPVLFSANEITVGCCTVDILKQLSSEEISRKPAGAHGDRIGRLAAHLLNQHSYYPLYPPFESVPWDLSLSPEALEIPSIPDLLLLPSDLATFVKVLTIGEGNEGETIKCICVNPGRLSKGIGGGTFVEINYNGDPESTNASVIRI